MDFHNRTPHSDLFKDYFLLKNYAITREHCFNEQGDLVKILFDEEIRKKYAKVYEGRIGTDINLEYKNVDKIIKEMQEHVIISSTRIDDIIFSLTYTSNIVGIHMTKLRPDKNGGREFTNIYTKLEEDGVINSYIEERIPVEQIGKTMLEEVQIIKKQLKLKFEYCSQNFILK